jgi:hypothetical protein
MSSDEPAKCYFGEPTPIGDMEKKYLNRPDAGRLFFISPPPSPPVGWEMKSEDPPNKEVHAEDLASKLAKLSSRITAGAGDESSEDEATKQYTSAQLQTKLASKHNHSRTLSVEASPLTPHDESSSPRKFSSRSRSSTLIYDPVAHGDSPALPAVMLETEDDSEVELDVPTATTIKERTSRPPVELMEH